MARGFGQTIFQHVPRAQNEEANSLSQLTTIYYDEFPKEVYMESRDQPSYEEKVLSSVLEEPHDWRTPIVKYLTTRKLPSDRLEAKKMHKFHMYQGELYKKLVEGLLLLCVSADNIPNVLFEVHNDNGPQFEESVLAEFCEKYGIERRLSPVYYPQANGEVEVMNRIVFSWLKKNMVQTGANKGAWP
ncbi:hypothetical protein LIER_07553 [Lithospermum erythrorhizon]|uniref:Integrase catalytic domain-containing protein n=1 Tax=Lithospermum erythrorhizon TaxID=34254 RepID=A0AAV3PCW5_LITER